MNQWFVNKKANQTASLRLFCFPYAGGDSLIFTRWASVLPEYVELFAVQMPGRGIRIRETPIDDMATLVDHLYHAILPYLDKPYLFLGHSLGTRVSFELMHRLRLMGQPLPLHFIASASKAPHLPRKNYPVYDLPDEAFLQELRELSGTPEELLANRELMELFMPMLRADFRLADLHQTQYRCKLACACSIWGGLQDSAVSQEDLKAWQEHFLQPINLKLFDGGHFFINDQRDDYLKTLIPVLETCEKMSAWA